MVRHERYTRSFRARTLSQARVPAEFEKGVRTAACLRRFWQRCMGGCGAMTCGRRPIQEMENEKPATGFPVRAFEFWRR
jgi:hypothetical protein